MRLIRLLAVPALLVVAASRSVAAGDPAVSLQGLFSDNDCEAAPEILGYWTGNSDLGGTWTLQKLGDRKYRLVKQVEESHNGIRPAFDICAAPLAGYLFFDATYQELRPDGKEVLGSDESGFWIPLHLNSWPTLPPTPRHSPGRKASSALLRRTMLTRIDAHARPGKHAAALAGR